MTDQTKPQQDVATPVAAAASVQSDNFPQVLYSLPSSTAPPNTVVPLVVISDQVQVAEQGSSPLGSTSPGAEFFHPQQQYHHHLPQHHQHYSHSLTSLSSQCCHTPHTHHHSPADSSHYGRHLYHSPQIEPYHQYSVHEEGHLLFHPPAEGQYAPQVNGNHQYTYASPFSRTHTEIQTPPNSAGLVPLPHVYHAAHYSPIPIMRDDQQFAYQMTDHAGIVPRRVELYQPYQTPIQQFPLQPQSSPLPLSSVSTSAKQVKDSTIFAPGARMVTDGSAANYGRLPDGKVIELFPAMIRTNQACEYCRNRKAKCSGGRPCERCEKKGEKCEYAQLIQKKRVKTKTSEMDIRCKDSKSSKSSGSGNKSNSTSKGKGGSSSSTKRTQPTRKSSRNRSSTKLKVEHEVASVSLFAPVVNEVPLDLSSSPFTPVSLLFQQNNNKENSQFMPSVPLSSSHAIITQPFVSSPSSTASNTSVEMFTSGPAPEAILSPMPFQTRFHEDAEDARKQDEIAAPSVTQESAFRCVNNTFQQDTNFF